MDLYEILKINKNVSQREIKQAYYKLAKEYHPDKNKNVDKKYFEQISYAYNILYDTKSRHKYNQINNKSKFEELLNKFFDNNLKIEELNHFGIKLSNDDFSYLSQNYQQLFEFFNFNDIYELFNFNKIKKRNFNDITESENDYYEDTLAEHFDSLPLYFLKHHTTNIRISLNISLQNLINQDEKKIKIKRKINNEFVETKFSFKINSQYIVFIGGGDLENGDIGNLVINLKLPKEYSWLNNTIYLNKNINIYELIYGVTYNFNNKEIFWNPSKDGLLIPLNFNFNKKFYIKLNLDFIYNEANKIILQNLSFN
jgi:curved DNA-binding protein CbpA